MSEPGDFLARWSRRKREAARADVPAEAREAPAGPPASVQAPAQPAEAPSLTEAELAELPAIDELTAESDVTAFLRAGVPQAMRNAALRRVWSLDPKIRDFVCEAQEYAYDWNVPGGVPGYGPLPAGFDAKALVGRLFGPNVAEPRAAAEAPGRAVGAVEAPPRQEAVGGTGASGSEAAAPPSEGKCRSAASDAVADGATDAPAGADAAGAARFESFGKRRHGGATPV